MGYQLFSINPLPQRMLIHCLLDPYEQNRMAFNLAYQNFNLKKCIWKCVLQNLSHSDLNVFQSSQERMLWFARIRQSRSNILIVFHRILQSAHSIYWSSLQYFFRLCWSRRSQTAYPAMLLERFDLCCLYKIVCFIFFQKQKVDKSSPRTTMLSTWVLWNAEVTKPYTGEW